MTILLHIGFWAWVFWGSNSNTLFLVIGNVTFFDHDN